jgi:hypothetical protein
VTRSDLLTAGSFILAAVNLTAMWLLARKKRAGFVIALAAQVPWTVYDLWTGQFGFLLITAASIPVDVKGWREWR